jgi:predicted DsbA family dithiol-disulfide isomerase
LPRVQPVGLVVYSDYLCPWCYNACVRMERLERELGAAVRVEWRSYLLRPTPAPGRDLDRFREYTRSWLRAAAEPDSGEFRAWEGAAGPPSHSVPAHRVAKAAARVSEAAFRALHRRLLRAYFAESRDVSDRDVLRRLWEEAGLPAGGFAAAEDPAILAQVLADHKEALRLGVSGVPAVRLADGHVAVVGAHPVDLYRRWVARAIAAHGAAGVA